MPRPRVLGRDVHAEHRRLVPVLRPRLAREPDDAGERAADERAEDRSRGLSGARRALGRRERLRRFLVVARREGIRMLARGRAAAASR